MSIRRASTSYLHSLDNSLSFGTQKRKYSNTSAGLGPAQFFLSSSSWSRPTNVNYIDIVLVGGGGGGGQFNYSGGGGGGVITYIKKFYVGGANTWYYYIGFGGDAAGTNSGVGISDTNSWGECGGPTMFGTNSSITSFNYASLNPINDPTILVSPGGGGGAGGGPTGEYGYFAGTGGGCGNGVGGSRGRLVNDEFYTTGHGFNGGAGGSASGGGGGSCTSTGLSGSGNNGGNGADGPDLLAPLPATFTNSASQVISTRFGGGGGGQGASVGGTGGVGGGGSSGSAGTANTGGGGGAGASGGSGVIIIWEHRS